MVKKKSNNGLHEAVQKLLREDEEIAHDIVDILYQPSTYRGVILREQFFSKLAAKVSGVAS